MSFSSKVLPMSDQIPVSLHTANDIGGALSASLEQGGLILTEQQLGEDFFNLRTGLAGELFQKFVNYRARLAIVIPEPGKYGQRFAELAYEHRRHAAVRFFTSVEDAQRWIQIEIPQA